MSSIGSFIENPAQYNAPSEIVARVGKLNEEVFTGRYSHKNGKPLYRRALKISLSGNTADDSWILTGIPNADNARIVHFEVKGTNGVVHTECSTYNSGDVTQMMGRITKSGLKVKINRPDNSTWNTTASPWYFIVEYTKTTD